MEDDLAIKVDNLSKVYPLRQPIINESGNLSYEYWALKDVSFEIKKGECVGIVGPNGSGKSTLMKILAGVTKPSTGTVKIRGKVASILDIGAGFHPELSGRENVFLNAQIHGFSRKEIEAKFDEIIKFSEINNFINEPVKHYSNGMYLRLAFSIMAHLDFDVYLLDEVLSVGDEKFKEKIFNLIQSWKSKKTMLVISHDMKETLPLIHHLLSVSDKKVEQAFIEQEINGPVNFIIENYINKLNIKEESYNFDIETKKYNLKVECKKKV